MRITTKDAPQPAFKPVVIEITCETQDELEAIKTIFTSKLLDEACKNVWPSLKATVYSLGNASDVKGETRTYALQKAIKAIIQ